MLDAPWPGCDGGLMNINPESISRGILIDVYLIIPPQ